MASVLVTNWVSDANRRLQPEKAGRENSRDPKSVRAI